MVRKITLDVLNNAVQQAYEEYKNLEKGAVDTRLENVDPNAFGITVVLNDGTTINAGDTDTKSPLGRIASLAVHSLLLQQYGVKELIKKAGKTTNHKVRKLDLSVSPHGVRAYSAVEPQNDFDGKYDLIIDNVINMMGSAPVLNDKLYEKAAKQIDDENYVDKLASVDYTVYDDTERSAKGYARLESLTANTRQIATFGATIANDGVNPVNGTAAYDATLSAPLTTIATIHGNTDRNRRWLLKAGVPAVFSYGGMALAIMPGIGAIAAYSPMVGKHGRSKKGARAIRYITNALSYNIFGSTYVEIEKNVEVNK